MKNIHLLIYGTDKNKVHPDILDMASSIHFEVYNTDKLMEPKLQEPNIILCYSPDTDSGVSSSEIAQLLRYTYSATPIFYIALDRKEFEKKAHIKNGFTQSYLLPWEKGDLLKSMKQECLYLQIPEMRNHTAVKVIDLKPGDSPEFSLKVYLPMNNKFLTFSESGAPISADKFEKIVQSNQGIFYIHNDEIEKLETYTKRVLNQMLMPDSGNELQRQEKLEKCVRELISDMFVDDVRENTFAKSQVLLREVKAVIELLISDKNQALLDKLNKLVNHESNFYQHFSNSSTYAGLFSIALGFEKPDTVALAGLLHDIGKINLPQEIADVDENEIGNLGPHSLEAYKKHPQYTVDIIRMKRMVLPPETTKAILHHHEHMDGSGYPEGLSGSKISREGRLLAIANEFDHLTSIRPDHTSLSPLQALSQMCENNSGKFGPMILDFEMLSRLKQILKG